MKLIHITPKSKSNQKQFRRDLSPKQLRHLTIFFAQLLKVAISRNLIWSPLT